MFPAIIVSGGIGLSGFDEAQVMKRYLEQEGIPAASIILDSQGSNTLLTAQNAAAIMREKGFGSALVISQYFHISRSRLFLREAGISPVYSAHADYVEWRDIYSTMREVAAIAMHVLVRLRRLAD